MKTKLLTATALVALFMSSCISYKMTDTGLTSGYALNEYCTPVYVATMSIHEKPFVNQADGSVTMKKPSGSELTLYAALEKARLEHGNDVTVTNFQWDIKTTVGLFGRKSEKVGMTFDVIRCK